jgi:hypothetical protein
MKLVDREKLVAELSEILTDECTLADMRGIVIAFVENELNEDTDDDLILLGEEYGLEMIETEPPINEETAEV